MRQKLPTATVCCAVSRSLSPQCVRKGYSTELSWHCRAEEKFKSVLMQGFL